jgi:ABC-type branched-subunit amino acid transport system permease subunit
MKTRLGTWLVGLGFVALLVLPLLVQGTYYRFLGIIVFIYGIVAIGLNILAGYAGQLSLGHAALMAMGAYTTAILTKALAPLPLFALTGLHIWLGIVAGTVVAAAFGALLAFPALRVAASARRQARGPAPEAASATQPMMDGDGGQGRSCHGAAALCSPCCLSWDAAA